MSNDLDSKKGILPKRRRASTNPYQIHYCGELKSYLITFKDGNGIKQTVVADYALYQAFNSFELEDLRELNAYDRHIEHSQLTDAMLHSRIAHPETALETIVEGNLQKELLHTAINRLPPVQHRRIKQYYFDGMTYEEIAANEGCSFQTVARTIESAKKNLKKFILQG